MVLGIRTNTLESLGLLVIVPAPRDIILKPKEMELIVANVERTRSTKLKRPSVLILAPYPLFF